MELSGVTNCPKCGSEMKFTDRYCMHCGYINYDNEANKNLAKYEKVAKKELKKEGKGSGEFINYNVKANSANQEPVYNSITEYEIKEENKVKKPASEKRYIFIHRVFRFVIFLLILSLLVYAYFFVSDKQKKYVEDANTIVNAIKSKYGSHTFKSCSGKDEYLFDFSDDKLFNNYHLDLKSPYNKEYYKGYVLVRKIDGKFIYYIALSDGTFGIREKNIDEVKSYNVLPYYDVKTPSIYTNCR